MPVVTITTLLKGDVVKKFTLPLLFVGLALGLASCSFAPLRFNVNLLEVLPQPSGAFTLETPDTNINLLPLLGSSATGGFRETSPIGGVTVPVEEVFPDALGVLLDFSNETLPATLEGATLRYAVALASSNLTGTLQVQPYLAPVDGGDASQAIYALGPAQTLILGEGAVLGADVPLNEAQLGAVNAKKVRLALKLSGNLGVVTAGEVSLSYTFRTLTLDVGSVSAGLDELLPDADGESFDFSDQEVPGPGRVVGLSLIYDVTLSHDTAASGALTAQIYIAPPGDEPLWSPQFAFGEPQTLDLSQGEVALTGRAALTGVQEEILDTRTVRVGVRVTGEATLELTEPITIDYQFNTLDLRASYAL